MKYKGYVGTVEYYEEEDGSYYYGKVKGLSRATVTYEGDTLEELKADFETGVDDYINYCKERQIVPELPKIESEPKKSFFSQIGKSVAML